MRQLPLTRLGEPNTSSPWSLLLWLMRRQGIIYVGAVLMAVIWMCAGALIPAALGNAIDLGVARADGAALLQWCVALVALGVVEAGSHIGRHRLSVQNSLGASIRLLQLLSSRQLDDRQDGRDGARLSDSDATSITTTDLDRVGFAIDASARVVGAVLALAIVAVMVFNMSVTLGLIVLFGAPLMVLSLTPLLRPLRRRQHVYRSHIDKVTKLGNDLADGLRALQGAGGERVFAERYGRSSQDLRRAGLKASKIETVIGTAEIFLPGLFVVILVWVGAHLLLAGRISAGDLVAFYAYAAFIASPIGIAASFLDQWSRGLIAADRINGALRLLDPTALPNDSDTPADAVPLGECFGVHELDLVTQGMFTTITPATPDQAFAVGCAVAEQARSGDLATGTPLLIHAGLRLFTGPLRPQLDPRGTRSDAEIFVALEAAAATDIVARRGEGLDLVLNERGSNLSGGERQRILIAQALLTDSDFLILVNPTSAVDATTEALIARRVRAFRRGRTTVVIGTSPALLAAADEVLFIPRGGERAVRGSHRDLLRCDGAYRALVRREE